MSFQILPIDSVDSSYTVDITLDNTAYKLDLVWNVRGEFWTCKLLNSSDDILCIGKLATNYPLFFRYPNSQIPKGVFWCVDSTNKGLEPTRDNLGTEILLTYEND